MHNQPVIDLRDHAGTAASRPLRVLHVAQPNVAGVTRCVAELALHQHRHGWQVVVAQPADAETDARLRSAGVTVRPWTASRHPLHGLRTEYRSLQRIVAETDPDIVTLHSSKAALVGRLVLRGSRVTVVLPHAWSFLAARGPMRHAAAWWERFAQRWTNSIVAVGEGEVAAGLRRRIYGPYALVSNPASTIDAPWGAHRSREEARASLGVANHVPLLVCVGRLCEQKGQDVLLRAWPAVRAAVPDAELVLIGDGPWQQQLEDQAAGDPSVRFLGWLADSRPWLAAADVVTLPSRWEGLSLVQLEAMAAARSLVMTEVAGSELVRRAGAGAVVPLEDADSLAAALVERLQDRHGADAEGRCGAEYVQRHHHPRAVGEAFGAHLVRAHAFGRAGAPLISLDGSRS
ncbi:MAG: glycosyltransferase [Acidimicrobiia bacterium]